MSDALLPVSLAERLDGSPDLVSVRQIADAVGVAVVTVRKWVATGTWPVSVEKIGREWVYPRPAIEEWLRAHEAGRLDAGDLGSDPDEMLTTRQIAERTGYRQSTVSSYFSLYGPTSSDPFPPADAVGRRRAGDVQAWFSRRRTRSGARAAAPKPGKTKRAPIARDVIDVHGIAQATGKSLDEAKTLMRRRSLAAMQLQDKVGRSRVWPRKELLAELRRLDRLEHEPAPPPRKAPAWTAGGWPAARKAPPRSPSTTASPSARS
ncbi:helix-turn-helix transcriptional regulator [Catenulispora yoronensis]